MAKGADPYNEYFLCFPQYFHMARHSGISGKCCKGNCSQSCLPLRLNRNCYGFLVKLMSALANTFFLTLFRLLRFRQRLKNRGVFGMVCQPLQQMTYLVSIDKFSALIGRRKQSFFARFGENRCKISGIMAASSKRSIDVSDLSPKKKPDKRNRYQEYRDEYGEVLHKKLQFF